MIQKMQEDSGAKITITNPDQPSELRSMKIAGSTNEATAAITAAHAILDKHRNVRSTY